MVDDVVKQVYLGELTAVGLVIQVSPNQVVNNKEQVALTYEVRELSSKKYESLMLKYTKSKSET